MTETQTEIFKPIPGYEGLYEVSNFGTVKSLARVVTIGMGRLQSKPEIVKKQHIGIHGYYSLGLSNSGTTKTLLTHRLVAQTFKENPNNYRCVNHKDGNKLNNSSDNLEWCTHSYNEKHAYDNGLKKGSWTGFFGSDNHRSKPILQIDRQGNLVKEWVSATVAAQELGIRCVGITSVCNGYDKTYKGFNWQHK